MLPLSVQNSSFEEVYRISDYSSLLWTERYNEPGEFKLKMPVYRANLNFLRQNDWLAKADSNRLMMIEKLEIEDGVLTVSGRDALAFLNYRFVRPITGVTGFESWGPRRAFREAFNRSAGFQAPLESDRLPGVFASATGTDNDTYGAPWGDQSLYSALKEIVDFLDEGFRLTKNAYVSGFTLALYEGLDRSRRQTDRDIVRFDVLAETLGGAKYLHDRSRYYTTVSTIYSGATLATMNAPSRSGWEKKSRVVSRTDIEGTNAFNRALSNSRKELNKSKILILLDGQALPSSPVYRTNYQLGDIVALTDAYGHEINVRVTEEIYSFDANGERSYPTFSEV